MPRRSAGTLTDKEVPMESNPIAPRQRNRRSERHTEPAQTQQPVQQVYQQPVQPPVYPQQQMYQQQMFQQQPRTMYQQPQQGYPQPSPAPQMRQPPQPVQPHATPRPRVLNQAGPVNSGWQQPTLQERTETSRFRASNALTQNTAQSEDAPAKKKVPGWLTGTTTACFLVLLALAAAYWLMQAYLTTEENERIAAHEALLEKYHVTEQADGTMNVTWQGLIEQYAAQYNLQPAFVTAIIRNESSFRTNAESSAGARGLMQLMPDTAEWIARKLDDSSYTFDRMWDAETNIRYGCWYLGYLSRLFHGDAELVSGAYHAGQTTITQWLSDRTKSADGVTLDLENLSDGPTKQYIGRVTQTYGIYQSLLYPDEAFGAANAMSAGSSDVPADAR